MDNKYKFVEPKETRQEMLEILVKALERSLTDDEVKIIYLLGDADDQTRGVLLNLFQELKQRIDYFKED